MALYLRSNFSDYLLTTKPGRLEEISVPYELRDGIPAKTYMWYEKVTVKAFVYATLQGGFTRVSLSHTIKYRY